MFVFIKFVDPRFAKGEGRGVNHGEHDGVVGSKGRAPGEVSGGPFSPKQCPFPYKKVAKS